jgi:trigger factor
LEKNIKQLEGSNQEIEIKMTHDELQPYYDDAYKKARPHIELKGFRKGKVPLNMIKRLYGSQIETEAQQDIISEVFTNVTKEENIRVIGQPELHDIQKGEDKSVTFRIKYEMIPDIELKDYKNLVIDEPVHAVKDEEIEAALKNIAFQYADFEVAQKIEDENFVVGIETRELDKESKVPLVDKEPQENHMFLADPKRVDPKLKDMLIGKSGDDTFEYQPDSPNEDEDAPLLQVKVNEIQKVVPKEMTPEFVEEYTKGKFDNVDDLKEEIGFNLQEQWDERSRQEMENQVVEQLVEMHPEVSAPEVAVKASMEDMLENLKRQYQNNPEAQNLTLDTMGESLRPMAERNVKWELIRNQIIKAENIEIEDYDVDPIIEKEAERMNQEKEKLKEMLMQNEQFLASILAKKVMDPIIEFSETNEVPFAGEEEQGGEFVDEDPTMDESEENEE